MHKSSFWWVITGVSLGFSGLMLYVPLAIQKISLLNSGTLAATLVVAINLGRICSSLGLSQLTLQGNRRLLIGMILLEGISVFAMRVFESAEWYIFCGFLGGLAGGISYPTIKELVSRIPFHTPAYRFAGLQFAVYVGDIVGALAGGIIGVNSLNKIFALVPCLFVGYGFCVSMATKDKALISSTKQKVGDSVSSSVISKETPRNENLEIKIFMLTCGAFWFLAGQHIAGFSLHIVKYVPSLSAATPFWIGGLFAVLFQFALAQKLHRVNIRTSIFLSFVLLTAGFSMLILNKSSGLVIISILCITLAEMIFIPSFDAFISTASGRNPGKLLSTQYLLQQVGRMTGIFFGGFLFDLAAAAGFFWLNWAIAGLLAGIFSISIYYFAIRPSFKILEAN